MGSRREKEPRITALSAEGDHPQWGQDSDELERSRVATLEALRAQPEAGRDK